MHASSRAPLPLRLRRPAPAKLKNRGAASPPHRARASSLFLFTGAVRTHPRNAICNFQPPCERVRHAPPRRAPRRPSAPPHVASAYPCSPCQHSLLGLSEPRVSWPPCPCGGPRRQATTPAPPLQPSIACAALSTPAPQAHVGCAHRRPASTPPSSVTAPVQAPRRVAPRVIDDACIRCVQNVGRLTLRQRTMARPMHARCMARGRCSFARVHGRFLTPLAPTQQ